MKKLIWSAFALSLSFSTSLVFSQSEIDFMGMEAEVMPELKGSQKFTPPNLHQKSEWNVDEKQVEIDATQPLRGQKHSLIPWDTQDPQEWLSIERWLLERELKDKSPDWKLRLRDDRHAENVGKILQCRGQCDIYRGLMKARVTHLSQVNEGDELKTGPNSIAWIYLMDGTLVRVGPLSAISFQEINWSQKEVFHLVRLHQGHVFWHPRNSLEFPVDLSPETDAVSLPLLVRESNQAYYERELFQKQSDFERSFESAKLEDTAISAQIKKLNELRVTNNSSLPPVSRVMMVAPNGTVVGKLTSFDFFHYPGGLSHFKKRLPQEGHELSLHLRGYSSTEVQNISEETWYQIETNGRSANKVEAITGGLEITELLTRRIKTFELAREIWLGKYTRPVVQMLGDSKNLAIQFGYTLWSDSLDKRFEFLVEYTRRMETTNLKSMDNLLKKVEAAGEVTHKEMTDTHYVGALNYYLKGLKTRYTDKKMQVREMNDLQYYIWILRHGKKKT